MRCPGRITSMEDPTDDRITGFIKEAKRLNDKNFELPSRKKIIDPKPLLVSVAMENGLGKNKTAVK